jgi:hypothetical protein
VEDPWLHKNGSGVGAMCYGNLDPKYMVREMDARLKSVAFEPERMKQAEPKPQSGLFAPVRAMLVRILRKGLRHV